MIGKYNYLRKRLPIVKFISDYITSKNNKIEYDKKLNCWKCICPFCDTANFTIDENKNIFYCFGCHSGGDVIVFASRMDVKSQEQTIKDLLLQIIKKEVNDTIKDLDFIDYLESNMSELNDSDKKKLHGLKEKYKDI